MTQIDEPTIQPINHKERTMMSKDYKLPYIEDKATRSAVYFALKMKQEGTPIGLAIYKAAKYYKTTVKEVAFYMGKVGSRANARRISYESYVRGKDTQ